MQISVVIPTYNRVFDLRECLNSLLEQTCFPFEVLVIDNSNKYAQEISAVIEEFSHTFSNRGVTLSYIYNNKGNSLTIAKNMGIENTSGELVSFLDDDVVLDRDYYTQILKVFKDEPFALGIEGRVSSTQKQAKFISFFVQLLGKLFRLGFREKDRCRVLSSLGVTYSWGDKVINCQWLSGASVFKRNIFSEFKYDESLKKYSDGEDLDFSYQIYKEYPDALFLAPRAIYLHKTSSAARASSKERIYMKEIYYLYLFYKFMEQSFINKLMYLWARFGEVIFKTISIITLRVRPQEFIYLIGAYGFCLRHLREIKNKDLDFFNKSLR